MNPSSACVAVIVKDGALLAVRRKYPPAEGTLDLPGGFADIGETAEESVSRELILVKVKYNKSTRREIMEICEILNASIVDMSKNLMMIQLCDTPERTKLLIQMLASISIVEVARTGVLALQKCSLSD